MTPKYILMIVRIYECIIIRSSSQQLENLDPPPPTSSVMKTPNPQPLLDKSCFVYIYIYILE